MCLIFYIGKFVEAFKYCQDLRMKGEFIDSLQWQTCALDITEVQLVYALTMGIVHVKPPSTSVKCLLLSHSDTVIIIILNGWGGWIPNNNYSDC